MRSCSNNIFGIIFVEISKGFLANDKYFKILGLSKRFKFIGKYHARNTCTSFLNPVIKYDENIAISPLSIVGAMYMLAAGAAGESRQSFKQSWPGQMLVKQHFDPNSNAKSQFLPRITFAAYNF